MRNLKIFYYISIASLAFSAATIALSFYALFAPINILEFKKFEVLERSIKKGDSVTIHMEFSKNFDTRGEIRWYLVDGAVIQLDGVMTSRRAVGESDSIRKVVIPDSPYVGCGEYALKVQIDYKILGGIRSLFYEKTSNKFTIECEGEDR